MDFDLPELPPDFRDHVEDACNADIRADRRIDVRVLPREEAFAIPDIIRTATNLIPDSVTDVRIVDIAGLDTQADGAAPSSSLARPAAAGATSRTALLPRAQFRLTFRQPAHDGLVVADADDDIRDREVGVASAPRLDGAGLDAEQGGDVGGTHVSGRCAH
ncbi:MAG TPA: hypothetical protein VKZ82_22935 [Nonomuraea sp.]|nr:hypothetical protein [Nonomuraea sp.]